MKEDEEEEEEDEEKENGAEGEGEAEEDSLAAFLLAAELPDLRTVLMREALCPMDSIRG